MSLEEMKNKINRQNYEIESLKVGVNDTLNAIGNLTDAVNKQTTQFAVYAEKHDRVSEEMLSIRISTQIHGESIAAMQPVVDGVRGLVWKVIFSSLAGGTALAGIIVAVVGK